MSESDDPSRFIADFVKGKSFRGASGRIATLTWSGKSLPPTFTPLDPNPTFSRMAGAHWSVAKALRKFNKFSTASLVGGLLTLPELQANSVRLQALAHLVAWQARGQKIASPAQISNWFDSFDYGLCGRLEDASEDVFIGNVSDERGNYRVFQGTSEGCSFYLQVFLDVMATMPHEGIFEELRSQVWAILRLSEAIAERGGLPRHIIGEASPRSTLPLTDDATIDLVRGRVLFSARQLSELGIEPAQLSGFVLEVSQAELIAGGTFGHSILEARPILCSLDQYVVALPNAIGSAVRRLIIETCVKRGYRDSLESAFAAVYERLLGTEILLGELRGVPLRFTRKEQFQVGAVATEIDVGRVLHLIAICDGLEGYEQNSFAGMNPLENLSRFVSRDIDAARRQFSRSSDFRQGLSLVVSCGWGRAVGVGLPQAQSDWRIEMIPVHDLVTISRKAEFKVLDLFRLLDSEEAMSRQGLQIVNPQGLLNLYSWVDRNRGHIVPHEELPSDPISPEQPSPLLIPFTEMLRLRAQVAIGVDMQRVRDEGGRFVLVRRLFSKPQYGGKSLSPYYVDIRAAHNRHFRAVYLGEKRNWWVEVVRNDDLDPGTMLRLAMMIQHWSEATARKLDSVISGGSVSSIMWRVRFTDIAMPKNGEAVPLEKDIHHVVQFEVSTLEHSANILVGRGFLNASRRPENLAERAIVRAMVASVLGIFEDSRQDLESLVQSVVRSEGARHFHVFSASEVRDHVAESLPEKGQVINRFDDGESRIGLGWSVRARSEGATISGKVECCAYLKELISFLIKRLSLRLAKFERSSTIQRALTNHEALAVEDIRWRRTFKSIRAMSDDDASAFEDAGMQIAKFNAASMTSRIVSEISLCVSPLGSGLKMGEREFGMMLADASLLFHLGGYRDAIAAQVMAAEIRISPGGDVLMNHEFTDKTVVPFGQTFQSIMLTAEADRYEQHYYSSEGSPEDNELTPQQIGGLAENQFSDAWLEEHKITLEEMIRFVDFFKAIAVNEEVAVVRFDKSDLMLRCQKESGLSAEQIEAAISAFSLKPRDAWDIAPEGFLASAWQPWRFRRQLSLISRPIVQLDDGPDPGLLIAPAMIVHHLAKFVYDSRDGNFEEAFFRSKAMRSYIGRVNREQGEAFNEKVATRFRELGWQAQANVTDGQILKRKGDAHFGDVDVLAWNGASARVCVAECKDLSFDKTFGEIARRLARFQGGLLSDGKRDDLRKHLDRVEILIREKDRLGNFVGMKSFGIESLVVTGQPVPMQFYDNLKKLGVVFVTIGGLHKI